MKIAIAHGNETAAQALERLVKRSHQVLWIARDGAEAVKRCRAARPDVLLMGLPLPELGAVETTRRIMAESPCAIIVCPEGHGVEVAQVYEAMSHGALDVAAVGGAALLEKIRTAGRLASPKSRITKPHRVLKSETTPLVALGASTGGPNALVEILHALGGAQAAVVIVQHVDPEFAPGLAQWLSSRSGFSVAVADGGERPRAGHALIASGAHHLVVEADGTLGYTAHPAKAVHRPSVDVFFRSAAKHWSGRGVAALLTGMGRDGAEGLLELRRSGWLTIAQDRGSSIVFGMPKAAVELRAAERVLPLEQIGAIIRQHLSRKLA